MHLLEARTISLAAKTSLPSLATPPVPTTPHQSFHRHCSELTHWQRTLESIVQFMENLPSQYEISNDCLARHIIAKSPSASTYSSESPEDSDDGSQLSDFSSYLSHEVWPTLPPSFHNASYETRSSLPDPDTDPDSDSMSTVTTLRLESIPTSFSDSLISYGICDDWDSAVEFLRKVVVDYLHEACKPPPVWSATRKDHKECEMCEREVPLTYHHLIPRSMHARVLKKGWHPEPMLGSVAWLCR